MDYQLLLHELSFSIETGDENQTENLIELFETNITTDLTNIMQTEGYIKLYFNFAEYIFEDNSTNKFPLPPEYDGFLGQYYQMVDRPNLDITL